MMLPVLTAYEKEHISERQPLPERYLAAQKRALAGYWGWVLTLDAASTVLLKAGAP